MVVLTGEDGERTYFNVWGPSTTDTDTQGREYPTPGMHKETQEVRDTGEDFLSDDVLVAWAGEDTGDLAVVLRDGALAWWRLHGGAIVGIEAIDWDPDPELARRALGGVARGGAGAGLRGLDLAVLRRRVRHEVVRELARRRGDGLDARARSRGVRLRRLRRAADLADVLERRVGTSSAVAGGSKLWS